MERNNLLKNLIVTVGLLATGVAALAFLNQKLDEQSYPNISVVTPTSTISRYRAQTHVLANTHTPAMSFPKSSISNRFNDVKSSTRSNKLVTINTSQNSTMMTGGVTSQSTSPSSVKQGQQIQPTALLAVSSRSASDQNFSQSVQTTATAQPFDESTEHSGSTISRKDFPSDPDDPFPNEDTPLDSGVLVSGLCALAYILVKRMIR